MLRNELRARESPVLSAAALVALQAEVARLRDVVSAIAEAAIDSRPAVAGFEAQLAELVEQLGAVGHGLLVAVGDLRADVEALRSGLLGG